MAPGHQHDAIALRQLAFADGQQLRACLVETSLYGAARCSCVSPAAELAGDGDRVGSITGPHRDTDLVWFRLLEQQDDVGTTGESHQVDETLGRARVVPGLRQHGQRHRGVDDPPAGAVLDAGEHAAPQLKRRERLVRVDRAVDGRQRSSGGHQVRRDPQRARCCVRMGEGVRVLHQPRGEARGQLGVQCDPELREHERHDLAGGRGGWIDQVRGPETRVADVVIDIHQRGACEPVGVVARDASRAREITGIDDYCDVRLELRLGAHAVDARQELQEMWDRVARDDLRLLAEPFGNEGHRQGSTERISVRALVADRGNPLRSADLTNDRGEVVGHRDPSWSSPRPSSWWRPASAPPSVSLPSTSWRSRNTRSPASIESSRRITSAGT